MKIDSAKFKTIIHKLTEVSESSVMLQRHACALVLGGKIISTGINSFNRCSKHAEIDAIDKILNKKHLNRCFLIVIRVKNDGSVQQSKPCSECVKQIQKYNIKRVCYSTDDGFQMEKGVDLITQHKSLYFRLNEH